MHHCKEEKKKKLVTPQFHKKVKKKTTEATKHIICEKSLNITQALFEISISGQLIFWIFCYIRLESLRRASCN